MALPAQRMLCPVAPFPVWEDKPGNPGLHSLQDCHIAGNILLHALSGLLCLLNIVLAVRLPFFPGCGNRRTGADHRTVTKAVKGVTAVFGVAAGIIQAVHQQKDTVIFLPKCAKAVGRPGAGYSADPGITASAGSLFPQTVDGFRGCAMDQLFGLK